LCGMGLLSCGNESLKGQRHGSLQAYLVEIVG
jgi:hypothetical protein